MLDWVQSQTKQVEFAYRKTRGSEAMVGVQKGYLEAVQSEVKRGTATVRNVEFAKLALDDAENAAMFNRIDYLGKLAELLSRIGRDPALAHVTLPRP